MTLERVKRRIVERLDEGDRGDRGWFIITRVHVELRWLRGIAEYIERKVGEDWLELSSADYRRLAEITEINSENPGQQLRRHHLLVMDKPLRLLQREDDRSWSRISLTPLGLDLATAADPAVILERSLDSMRFAMEPWSPTDRADQYRDFDVAVYRCAKQVLNACDGYLTRDEFDFFLSRVRRQAEVVWAIRGINEFRNLTPVEQESLRVEVSGRITGAKAYQNWRDQALHTFSLFSLGTSMVRDGQQLWLTSTWVAGQSETPEENTPREPRRELGLRLPEPPEGDDLLEPPAAPASNVGADGESYVAKVLRSQGWRVAFYTDKRGYGFDLWARKGNRAMVLEVKSSVGEMGQVSLTPKEFEAAVHYAENYVLALVENINSSNPTLWMIQNPSEVLQFVERRQTDHIVTAREWRRFAVDGN